MAINKKTIGRIVIILGVILLTAYFVYRIYTWMQPQPTLELFSMQTDKYYGNILVSQEGLTPSKDPGIIRLPGRNKLTGFKIDGVKLSPFKSTDNKTYYALTSNILSTDKLINVGTSDTSVYVFATKEDLKAFFPDGIEKAVKFEQTITTSNEVDVIEIRVCPEPPTQGSTVFWAHTEYTPPTYRLTIADNETDISDPSKRVAIEINQRQTFNTNTAFQEYKEFETQTGSAKYSGSVLRFEGVKPDLPLWVTGYTVYGMAAYAPGFADYDVMQVITSKVDPKGTILLGDTTQKNFKVGYIEFPNNTGLSSAETIRIQYDNTYDNQTGRFNADGPIQLGFSKKSKYIFMAEPIVARTLFITPADLVQADADIKVYGLLASKDDERTFKLEQNKYDAKGIVISGQKCPNIGQMMQKQLQAQQICEALEHKDRMRNKKLAYEQNKVYLKKLEEQDTELKTLSSQITELIEKKNARVRASSGSADAKKLERELGHIEQLRAEADAFMKNPMTDGLHMKVNLDPSFKDLEIK